MKSKINRIVIPLNWTRAKTERKINALIKKGYKNVHFKSKGKNIVIEYY